MLHMTIAGIFVLYSCRTHYQKASENYRLVQDAAAMERGKNIAYNVCGGCHYNRELNKFVGHQMKDLPKFIGKVYTSNLTRSKKYGVLTHYTDAQLAYLIKTGIKHDGRFIPYMIRPTMADDDVNDVIVYMRYAEDPALEPGDTIVGTTHLSFLGKLANSMTQKPQEYKTGIKRPDPNNAVANGRYLVDILGCYHCHSKNVLGLNYANPEDSKGYMAGGMKFKTLQGNRVRGANLTPDKGTGIGKYSQADFHKALADGKTPDGRQLQFPMPKFKRLTEKQIDQIYAYLNTLPPKYHKTR
jgi:cytochrome c1